MGSFKIPSRNKAKSNTTHIECPYCHYKYLIEEETEDDYFQFSENTKIHWCRQCGEQFINGKTKDIAYKYS